MQLVMRTAPRRRSYAYSRCIIYAQEFYASSIRCSCSKPRLDLEQSPPSLLVNEEFGETPPRPEGGMNGGRFELSSLLFNPTDNGQNALLVSQVAQAWCPANEAHTNVLELFEGYQIIKMYTRRPTSTLFSPPRAN